MCKPDSESNESSESTENVEDQRPPSILGWSPDIKIYDDLTEPAIPPEEWYMNSAPDRV